MILTLFRSSLEGWRRNVRVRLLLISGFALGVFLLSTPFPSQRWFGLAVWGFACAHFGLMSLMALTSKRYAKQWLEDSTPSDMTYRLLLTTAMMLGGGIALIIAAYVMWLDIS